MGRAPGLSVAARVAMAALMFAAAPAAADGAVTVTSPPAGALVTGGQPVFAGSNDAPGTVTVDVYTGSVASGAVAEELTAAGGDGGSWLAPVASPLSDGAYTVVATSAAGAQSAPVSFRVFNGAPSLTLSSPGAAPLRAATPTLSGTASTTAGAAAGVAVAIYPGASTVATPVAVVFGDLGSGGAFHVRVAAPGLADGRYTAVAAQGSTTGGAVAYSAPVTFAVKLHAPALTLTSPAPGTNLVGGRVVLAGAAGDTYGDWTGVAVAVYAGAAPRGRPLFSATVPVSSGSWSASGPTALAPGLYTVVAHQGDDAGHTTWRASTFLMIAAPGVVGTDVRVLPGAWLSVPVSCPVAGTACSGDVLVVTRRAFEPVPGGPRGALRLMFTYFPSSTGPSFTALARLPRAVLGALRGRGAQEVIVTALIHATGGHPVLYTATRLVQVGG